MTVEIISWSISRKIWYRAGIELGAPGSAVRHAYVARHVTDCSTLPGQVLSYAWESLGKHVKTRQIHYQAFIIYRPWAGYRPPSPPRGNFVHYDFLKLHYIRHKIKDVSPLRVAALTCNITLYTLPPKIALNVTANVSTMTCSYIFARWHRFMNFL